jgi:hypothetical protein
LDSYPENVDWFAPIEPRSLNDLFTAACAEHADRPCIQFLGREYSYSEIAELTARAARGMRALGVGRGVRVALLLPNTPYHVVCYFAILAGGLVRPAQFVKLIVGCSLGFGGASTRHGATRNRRNPLQARSRTTEQVEGSSLHGDLLWLRSPRARSWSRDWELEGRIDLDSLSLQELVGVLGRNWLSQKQDHTKEVRASFRRSGRPGTERALFEDEPRRPRTSANSLTDAEVAVPTCAAGCRVLATLAPSTT